MSYEPTGATLKQQAARLNIWHRAFCTKTWDKLSRTLTENIGPEGKLMGIRSLISAGLAERQALLH